MYNNIRKYAHILRIISEISGLEKPYGLQFCMLIYKNLLFV